MKLEFLSWNCQGQSIPDLQNLGWSTKLRKGLHSVILCHLLCFIGVKLWKIWRCTVAPTFLVPFAPWSPGLIQDPKISASAFSICGKFYSKRTTNGRFFLTEETHLSSNGGALPDLYRKDREKEGQSEFAEKISVQKTWRSMKSVKKTQDLRRRGSGLDGYSTTDLASHTSARS